MLKLHSTHRDLTQDVGSGNRQQDLVVQAQQLGLCFQHGLHAEDFLVQDDVVVGRFILLQNHGLFLVL